MTIKTKRKMAVQGGINYVQKKVKRGYLKADEMNLLLVITSVFEMIGGLHESKKNDKLPMWEEWRNRGILTEKQAELLKQIHGLMKEFVFDVIQNNLDGKTMQTILKRSSDFQFRVVDRYQANEIDRMVNKIGEVKLTQEEFSDLVDGKVYAECRGCTKNRCECDLHSFFTAHLVPATILQEHYDACNCEFALPYTKQQLEDLKEDCIRKYSPKPESDSNLN